MSEVPSNPASTLFEMGQFLSNLASNLFEMDQVLSVLSNLARQEEAETIDEDNGYNAVIHCKEVKKPIHRTSGYGNTIPKDNLRVKATKGSGDGNTIPKDDLRVKATKGRVGQEKRRIKYYYRSHKILLVGEGDFSFSVCLARVFGSADNMVATSLNSKGFLKTNYGNAMANINDLKSRGCLVLHGVDATTMSGHKFLKGMKFDRIVFNFPYAGLFKKESRESQISRHQNLVTLFFKNAKKMLSREGEIHVSHKSIGFHSEWNIETLASLSGLNFINAMAFNLNDYPGYNTKYGFGGDENFNCNPSKTYMFRL